MGSIIFLAVIVCMFIFGLMLYFGSFFYAYFFSRSGRNILFRDYYECGFKSISDNRNVVDIHFFVIGLIFLIYDMEIILFIPLLLNLYSYSLVTVIIILALLLLLGLSF
jgi:NADH:ubiquinone oxidoreductase subunit 3 (subunit A)